MADLAAAAPDLPAAPANRALRRAQCRTLALLFLGYAACYFCRSNLSVATPLIIEELGRRGISHDAAKEAIGLMASWGVFAYVIGKCFLTGLGDYWGGKRNLLIATGGATLFTLIFAASSTLPIFTMAWIGNRVVQSIGWSALIKVSSKWFQLRCATARSRRSSPAATSWAMRLPASAWGRCWNMAWAGARCSCSAPAWPASCSWPT